MFLACTSSNFYYKVSNSYLINLMCSCFSVSISSLDLICISDFCVSLMFWSAWSVLSYSFSDLTLSISSIYWAIWAFNLSFSSTFSWRSLIFSIYSDFSDDCFSPSSSSRFLFYNLFSSARSTFSFLRSYKCPSRPLVFSSSAETSSAIFLKSGWFLQSSPILVFSSSHSCFYISLSSLVFLRSFSYYSNFLSFS